MPSGLGNTEGLSGGPRGSTEPSGALTPFFQEMAINTVNGLMPLSCEKTVLGGQPENAPACPVPASILQGWNSAREAANSLVENAEAAQGRHQKELLSKKIKMLEQTDRSFRIDLGFVGSLAEHGGALRAPEVKLLRAPAEPLPLQSP